MEAAATCEEALGVRSMQDTSKDPPSDVWDLQRALQVGAAGVGVSRLRIQPLWPRAPCCAAGSTGSQLASILEKRVGHTQRL